MTSVYARILLKYENTRIGEKIQCHASCGLDVRVTNTIQLQSKQEWLIFVHFSSAYNYHVLLKAAYVSKISCKLLRFLSFSCTRPRSKVWKNPEKFILSNLSFMATIFVGCVKIKCTLNSRFLHLQKASLAFRVIFCMTSSLKNDFKKN